MNDNLTFVDTNILVYAYDIGYPEKRAVAASHLRQLWIDGTGVISTQVLQEFYNAATRKLTRPITRNEARRVIGTYASWPVQTIDASDLLHAAEVEEVEHLSFWDALIVVSASRAGARRILSEDLQDGRTVRGIRIENPFSA
jgi:predicted nucleic acid-binding protein